MLTDMIDLSPLSTVVLTHFQRQEPLIHQLLLEHQIQPLVHETNHTRYFQRLCREIIGQQLSIKSADAIIQRFEELFPARAVAEPVPGEYRQHLLYKHQVEPEALISLPPNQLRAVGLSNAKVKYVRCLAEAVLNQEVTLDQFATMSDQAIRAQLQAVKGIGQWTVEMFLIFSLGREDIFSVGDLGLRRGMEKLYHQPWSAIKDELSWYVDNWRPYRSYASLALWKLVD